LRSDSLVWIENSLWIQYRLDTPHDIHCFLALGVVDETSFLESQSMLSRYAAPHLCYSDREGWSATLYTDQPSLCMYLFSHKHKAL
jgi:hypothetical protein